MNQFTVYIGTSKPKQISLTETCLDEMKVNDESRNCFDCHELPLVKTTPEKK